MKDKSAGGRQREQKEGVPHRTFAGDAVIALLFRRLATRSQTAEGLSVGRRGARIC